MRIAVYTGSFVQDLAFDKHAYITEIYVSLANQQPYHQFLIISNHAGTNSAETPANVEHVFLNTDVKNSIFTRSLISNKLKRTIENTNADVLVTFSNFSFPAKLPLVWVLDDPALLRHSTWFKKRLVANTCRKAKVICTISEFLKLEVSALCSNDPGKVKSIAAFTTAVYQPVNWQEKETLKETFADACEYFLLVMRVDNKEKLLLMLKAFSVFKKWQRTNMKLLVINRSSRQISIDEKLKTYKYRDDVKVMNDLEEKTTAKILSGAYAVIHPDYNEGFAYTVLQAMQCQVPVIASNRGSIAEIGGNAVLYADTTNPQQIADQMKRIFKDEQLRNDLVALARQRAENFSLQKTSALLWQAVQQATSE